MLNPSSRIKMNQPKALFAPLVPSRFNIILKIPLILSKQPAFCKMLLDMGMERWEKALALRKSKLKLISEDLGDAARRTL